MKTPFPIWMAAIAVSVLAGAWAVAADSPGATPGRVIPIPGGEIGEQPVRPEQTFETERSANPAALDPRGGGVMTLRRHDVDGARSTFTDSGFERQRPAPTALEEAKLEAARRAIEANAGLDIPALIPVGERRNAFDASVLERKERLRLSAEPKPLDHIPGGVR